MGKFASNKSEVSMRRMIILHLTPQAVHAYSASNVKNVAVGIRRNIIHMVTLTLLLF